ncbi:MAG: hypothetical protein JSU03_12155 [Bacteroidetes bacterium]|nr:hypothetical protein [Bacteroidota bacterium]
MNDSKQIEIGLSKSKLTLMGVSCVIFIAGGIFLILNPAKYESFIMRSPTIIFVSGLLSIIFFGIVGFFILKKIIDKSPGLIISDEGITDNSSGVSAGFIPWTDIIAIKETKVVNQKFINIIVKKPQEYIDRQKSTFKRRAMKANYNMWGTAIGISVNGLNINFSELEKILQKRFANFRQSAD